MTTWDDENNKLEGRGIVLRPISNTDGTVIYGAIVHADDYDIGIEGGYKILINGTGNVAVYFDDEWVFEVAPAPVNLPTASGSYIGNFSRPDSGYDRFLRVHSRWVRYGADDGLVYPMPFGVGDTPENLEWLRGLIRDGNYKVIFDAGEAK